MKKSMFAAALTALAFAALPAVAAATPHMDLPQDPSFTVSGGQVQWTGATSTGCGSVSGEGEFDPTGETGHIQLTFHECTESTFGSACTTPGSPTGTITTTEVPFHLKTATGDQTPAMLITTSGSEGTTSGHFASYECLGGFIGVEVTGNGIVGEITSPGYNTSSSTFGITFATNEEGKQTPDHVDETPETTYHLFESVNGGEHETTTLDSELTTHFAESATLTKT